MGRGEREWKMTSHQQGKPQEEIQEVGNELSLENVYLQDKHFILHFSKKLLSTSRQKPVALGRTSRTSLAFFFFFYFCASGKHATKLGDSKVYQLLDYVLNIRFLDLWG